MKKGFLFLLVLISAFCNAQTVGGDKLILNNSANSVAKSVPVDSLTAYDARNLGNQMSIGTATDSIVTTVGGVVKKVKASTLINNNPTFINYSNNDTILGVNANSQTKQSLFHNNTTGETESYGNGSNNNFIYDAIAYNGSVNDTGAIVLEYPIGWDNHMESAEIDGYNYSDVINNTYKIKLGFYNYSGSGGYYVNYLSGGSVTGQFNRQVRLAYVNSHICIIIGDTTDIWQYPKINLAKATLGHAAVVPMINGWSAYKVRSFSGFTQVSSVPLNPQIVANSDTANIKLTSISGASTYYTKLQNNYNASERWTLSSGNIKNVGDKTVNGLAKTYLSSYYGIGLYTGVTDPATANERLTILQNGNVGINQVSPSYTLDVAGNLRVNTASASGTNPQILLNSTGDAIWSTGNNINFRSGNVDYLKLDASGTLSLNNSSLIYVPYSGTLNSGGEKNVISLGGISSSTVGGLAFGMPTSDYDSYFRVYTGRNSGGSRTNIGTIFSSHQDDAIVGYPHQHSPLLVDISLSDYAAKRTTASLYVGNGDSSSVSVNQLRGIYSENGAALAVTRGSVAIGDTTTGYATAGGAINYKLNINGLSSGRPLNILGVPSGATTDSILTLSSGVVRKLSIPQIVGNSGWSLLGNSGTTAGTNFIGTTDNVPLVFKQNNSVSGIINSTLNSTSFGYVSTPLGSTGTGNSAFGHGALNGNTSGYSNTIVGSYSALSNTSGFNNVAVGVSTLYNNRTGLNNTAIGTQALYSDTANYNTALGYQAGYNNISGTINHFLGYQAGFNNTSGSNNYFSGYGAGLANTTGGNNTAIGLLALQANKTTSNLTAVGYQALYSDTSGSGNTAIGYQSMYYDTTGINNTALGHQSLQQNRSGSYNTAIGLQSGFFNINGYYNTLNGAFAGYSNTTGSNNSSYGYASLYSNVGGADNNANGWAALYSNTSGNNNNALGYSALYNNISGGSNIGIGTNAGLAIKYGSYNTYLGVISTGVTNEAYRSGLLAIGNPNYGTYIFGDSTGAIGIGTVTPQSKLAIGGDLQVGLDTLPCCSYSAIITKSGVYPYAGLTVTKSDGSGYFHNATLLKNSTTGQQVLGNYTYLNSNSPTLIVNNELMVEADTFRASGVYPTIGSRSTRLSQNNNSYLANNAYNVGIGNTAPSYKLDVSGTARISSLGTGATSDLIVTSASGVLRSIAPSTLISNNAWSLTGNSGTTSYTNYIGTNDAVIMSLVAHGYTILRGNLDSTTDFGAIANGNYLHLSKNSNTGYVGDGLFGATATPSSFQIAGGGSKFLFGYSDGGTGSYAARLGTTFAAHISGTTQKLSFGAVYDGSFSVNNGFNNIERLRVDTTGKVGIGTTAPSKLLDVVGGDAKINGVNVGLGGGNNNTNLAFGTSSLLSNSGTYTTGLGTSTLGSNTGNYNTAVGSYSLSLNTSGSQNIAIGGINALGSNLVGSRDIAIGGANTMLYNTSGSDNIAIGDNTLRSNTTGSNNTAIGNSALYSAKTLNNQTAIGSSALYSDTSGTGNTAIGYQSMYYDTTGINNTAVGYLSLQQNRSGSYNTGIGISALLNNTSGNQNTALGESSLYQNSTGFWNVANGSNALQGNTTGSNNTGVGYNAIPANTTGSYNIGIGRSAGLISKYGSYNTYIGTNTIGVTNEAYRSGLLAIGNPNYGTYIFGDSTGAIGIGTTTPAYKLQVNGTLYSNFHVINGSTTNGFNTYSVWQNNGTSIAVAGSDPAINSGSGSASDFGLSVYGNNKFFIETNAGKALTIDGSQQVGIGTTTPAYKLDVNGTGRYTGFLYAASLGTSDLTAVNVKMNSLNLIQLNSDTTTQIGSIAGNIFLKLPKAIYSSYTPDGVFGSTSTPAMYQYTSSSKLYFGYSDGGSGNYAPRFGTTYNASSSTIQKNSFGSVYDGSFTVNNGFNNTERFRIDSTGNISTTGSIGVGTTSFYEKLFVNGTILGGDASATNGSLILAGQYSGQSDYIGTFGTMRSSGGTMIGFGVRPSPTVGRGFNSSTNANLQRGAMVMDDNGFNFYAASTQTVTQGTAITLSQKMAILLNGNVGIGVSSPSYLLDVNGTARVSGNVGIGTAPTSNALEVNGNVNVNAGNIAIGGGQYISYGTGTLNGYIGSGTLLGGATSDFAIRGTNSIGFGIGSSQKMTLASNGYLGIGTVAPAYSLEVRGTSAFTGLINVPFLTTSASAGDTLLTTNGSGGVTKMNISGDNVWGTRGNTASTSSYIGSNNDIALILKVNGIRAGNISHTNFNTFLGYSTNGFNNSTSCTGIGAYALADPTMSGSLNTAIGYNAMFSMVSGSNNTSIGGGSLKTVTTTNNNTAIGYNTLTNSTGGSNTAIGYSAGSTNTTGSSNVYLGYTAGQTSNNTESNQLYIGNGSTSATTWIRGDSTYKVTLQKLNVSTLPTGTSQTDSVLTVNAGNVQMMSTKKAYVMARNSTTSLTSGSSTQIAYTTVVKDSLSNFSSNTFTAPRSGIYLVAGAVAIVNGGGVSTVIDVTAGGTCEFGTSSQILGSSSNYSNTLGVCDFSASVFMNAGETIFIKATQTTGSTQTASGSTRTYLTIKEL